MNNNAMREPFPCSICGRTIGTDDEMFWTITLAAATLECCAGCADAIRERLRAGGRIPPERELGPRITLDEARAAARSAFAEANLVRMQGAGAVSLPDDLMEGWKDLLSRLDDADAEAFKVWFTHWFAAALAGVLRLRDRNLSEDDRED